MSTFRGNTQNLDLKFNYFEIRIYTGAEPKTVFKSSHDRAVKVRRLLESIDFVHTERVQIDVLAHSITAEGLGCSLRVAARMWESKRGQMFWVIS